MLVFIGDIHGKWIKLIEKLTKCQIDNCSVLHVGDFGIGFCKSNKSYREIDEYNELVKMNDYFNSQNIEFYLIRGNHDNPAYFKNSSNDHIKKCRNLSNIHFLNDYEIIQLDGHHILTLGGAVSIDRNFRVKDATWWSNEGIDINLNKLPSNLSDIDIVLAHSSPTIANPAHNTNFLNFLYLERADEISIYADCLKEREYCKEVFDKLPNLKYWIYGHFHIDEKTQYKNTQFICLNELSLHDII